MEHDEAHHEAAGSRKKTEDRGQEYRNNDEIKANPAAPAANFNRLRQMEQQNGSYSYWLLQCLQAVFACLAKNPEA